MTSWLYFYLTQDGTECWLTLPNWKWCLLLYAHIRKMALTFFSSSSCICTFRSSWGTFAKDGQCTLSEDIIDLGKLIVISRHNTTCWKTILMRDWSKIGKIIFQSLHFLQRTLGKLVLIGNYYGKDHTNQIYTVGRHPVHLFKVNLKML